MMREEMADFLFSFFLRMLFIDHVQIEYDYARESLTRNLRKYINFSISQILMEYNGMEWIIFKSNILTMLKNK